MSGLQDMSYHTNYKDGKPKRSNYVKDTPNPLNKANMAEIGPWCGFCTLPHAPDHCVIAQSILEEINQEMKGK